jgi:aldehyde:ferredoxin oxidoreductase
MPGCVIQCSNVYADEDGNEMVSPVEYETIGLLGTNCGITDPDDLAPLNFTANDIGVDTIEIGATIGVMMDAGLAKFGDIDFMKNILEQIKQGSKEGRLWAQGAYRVGEHYQVKRVPEIVAASMGAQVVAAAADSLGMCIFGRSVTDTNLEFIADALNDGHGTSLSASFLSELGKETLELEHEFNRAAGFDTGDNELPQFFYDEPVEPTGKVARFHSNDVETSTRHWWTEEAK